MSFNIKSLLESYLTDIKYDKDLLTKLKNFKYVWGAKDDAYIEFLGSGLIGIHPIRFSSRDEDMLTRDILGIDNDELQSDLYQTPGVNKNFKVSSNSINILLVFLMHKFATVYSGGSYDKLEAMNILYHIFAYKQIGSLYSHYFGFEVDRNLAQSVFEELPNKFLIKKLGSWEAVFDYQATLLLPPKGANNSRIITFSDDDVVKAINDMQGRIRSTVKNITKVLYDFINSPSAKIQSTSLVTETEEGEGIKDVSSGYNVQTDYIKSILHSPNDFVDDDIIYLVCGVLKNCKSDKLKDVLYNISINHSSIDPNNDYVSTIIKQSLTYLRTKGITSGYRKNLPKCLGELKGYFSASKVKNKDIDNAKSYLFKLSSNILRTKTKWMITPIVLGIFLYIFIRSIKTSD